MIACYTALQRPAKTATAKRRTSADGSKAKGTAPPRSRGSVAWLGRRLLGGRRVVPSVEALNHEADTG